LIYISKNSNGNFNYQDYWRNESQLCIKKYVPLTDQQIRTILINDWKKNVEQWKKLNLIRINFENLLDVHSCLTVIKNIVNGPINEALYFESYTNWANKNNSLISK
jgi:hypothetical protein